VFIARRKNKEYAHSRVVEPDVGKEGVKTNRPMSNEKLRWKHTTRTNGK